MAENRCFSRITSKKLPAMDKSISERLNRLRLRLNPPNHRYCLSPKEKATAAAKCRGAEISSAPENGAGDVSFRQRDRDSFIGGAKLTSQATRTTKIETVPGPTLPPQQTLRGARVSIVDTSAAVPGSIDLNWHDPQRFRGCLQRNNAIRRKNRGRQEGGAYETGREGGRVFFEDSREETRWRGSRRSKRSSIRSARAVGTELLPLSPIEVMPSHLKGEPSSPRRSREHKSDQKIDVHEWIKSTAQTGKSDPHGAVRWPMMDSIDSRDSAVTVPAATINEESLPLWLQFRLRNDRSRALADLITQDTNTAARIGRVFKHTGMVHRTASARSHPVVLETATSSVVDEDEQRANRLMRQRGSVDQRLTAAWWRNSRSRSRRD